VIKIKNIVFRAYEYFQLAAERGNQKALEYMGFGHLLGDYVALDPERSLQIFQDLSDNGVPKGQLVSKLFFISVLCVWLVSSLEHVC